jgi:transposase
LSKARQHLQSFLLRHDQIYRGVRAWTLAYRRWLTTVRFAHPAQQIVLQDYVHAVQDAEARLDRLTRQIEELLPSWSMAAVVTALPAMRGGRPGGGGHRGGRGRRLSALRQCATADGLSWPGAVRAFVRSQIRAWWHPQGRQCSGPARADRRSLDLPHASRVSRKLHDRNEKLPPAIRDIAWEAQTRLCSRYRRLAAAGKPKVVVTTAIAREMVGFIWAIARIAQPALSG